MNFELRQRLESRSPADPQSAAVERAGAVLAGVGGRRRAAVLGTTHWGWKLPAELAAVLLAVLAAAAGLIALGDSADGPRSPAHRAADRGPASRVGNAPAGGRRASAAAGQAARLLAIGRRPRCRRARPPLRLDRRRSHQPLATCSNRPLRGAGAARRRVPVLRAIRPARMCAATCRTDPSTATPSTPRPSFDVKIEPGNTEIERGTSLFVVAEFARVVPPDATLIVTGSARRRNANRGYGLAAWTIRNSSAACPPSPRSDLLRRIRRPSHRNLSRDRVRLSGIAAGRCRAGISLVYAARADRRPGRAAHHGRRRHRTHAALQSEQRRRRSEAAGQRRSRHRARARRFATRASRLSRQLDAHRVAALQVAAGRRRPAAESLSDRRSSSTSRPIVRRRSRFERPGRDVDVSPLEELQLKANVTDDLASSRAA